MGRYGWSTICLGATLGVFSFTVNAGEPTRLAPAQLDVVTAGVDVVTSAGAESTSAPSFSGAFTRSLIRQDGDNTVGAGFSFGLATGEGERNAQADTEVSGDNALFSIPVNVSNQSSGASLDVAFDLGVFGR